MKIHIYAVVEAPGPPVSDLKRMLGALTMVALGRRFGVEVRRLSPAAVGDLVLNPRQPAAGAYSWNRATIHDRIQRLVRTRTVFVEDVDLVDEALEEYAAGRSELADYLILGKARQRAGELLTFNKKLAKEQDATLL